MDDSKARKGTSTIALLVALFLGFVVFSSLTVRAGGSTVVVLLRDERVSRTGVVMVLSRDYCACFFDVIDEQGLRRLHRGLVRAQKRATLPRSFQKL